MKLALRSTSANDANRIERAFAALTRWRLASQWCHAGIVVGDQLYHANARHGLHASSYTPARWWLLDLGHEHDQHALRLFRELQGAGYDYLGALGFGLPCIEGAPDRLYCFEWCALAMDIAPHRWMTPERLLAAIATKKVAATPTRAIASASREPMAQ